MIPRFVLIVGAMKAGTTTLFRWLSEHPAIAPCSLKEPDFFSRRDLHERGMSWYEGLWEWRAGEHRWALEASTSYTMRPAREGVAGRVASEPREWRAVYLVRDPVERIRSHYAHHLVRSGRSGQVTREVRRDALDFSRYAMQLDPWVDALGRDAVLVLRHDALAHEPFETLARTLRFLDLPPLPDEARSEAPDTAAHNTRAELAGHQVLSRLLRRLPPLELVRKALPAGLRRRLRLRVGDWVAPQVEIGPDEAEEIRRTLAPDLQRLAGTYGIDVSDWLPGGTEAE